MVEVVLDLVVREAEVGKGISLIVAIIVESWDIGQQIAENPEATRQTGLETSSKSQGKSRRKLSVDFAGTFAM